MCVGSAGLKDLLAEVVDVVRLRAGLVWAHCCACLVNISLPAEARLGRRRAGSGVAGFWGMAGEAGAAGGDGGGAGPIF